jgi:hypothetical protein
MRSLFGSGLLLFSMLKSLFENDSALPDPKLTPGDSVEGVAVEQQEVGYSKEHRHVSEALRRAVFAEYGIGREKRNDYEMDHLISVSLGGSNSIENLWPEPLRLNVDGKDLGAVTKDAFEDRLHWLGWFWLPLWSLWRPWTRQGVESIARKMALKDHVFDEFRRAHPEGFTHHSAKRSNRP